jgi:hypothetical protein
MMRYIHQLDSWPKFIWDHGKIAALLGSVRNRQGRLMGRMDALGFAVAGRQDVKMRTFMNHLAVPKLTRLLDRVME